MDSTNRVWATELALCRARETYQSYHFVRNAPRQAADESGRSGFGDVAVAVTLYTTERFCLPGQPFFYAQGR